MKKQLLFKDAVCLPLLRTVAMLLAQFLFKMVKGICHQRSGRGWGICHFFLHWGISHFFATKVQYLLDYFIWHYEENIHCILLSKGRYNYFKVSGIIFKWTNTSPAQHSLYSTLPVMSAHLHRIGTIINHKIIIVFKIFLLYNLTSGSIFILCDQIEPDCMQLTCFENKL